MVNKVLKLKKWAKNINRKIETDLKRCKLNFLNIEKTEWNNVNEKFYVHIFLIMAIDIHNSQFLITWVLEPQISQFSSINLLFS